MGIIEGAEDRDKMMDLCLECASSWETKPVNDTQSEAFLTSLLGSMEPVFDGIIIGIMMIQSLHAVGYLRLSVVDLALVGGNCRGYLRGFCVRNVHKIL